MGSETPRHTSLPHHWPREIGLSSYCYGTKVPLSISCLCARVPHQTVLAPVHLCTVQPPGALGACLEAGASRGLHVGQDTADERQQLLQGAGSASPALRPHAQRVLPSLVRLRRAGRETAPQTPDWSGVLVGAGTQATSCTAPSRRGRGALSVGCQEDTRRAPFKTMAPAFKLRGAAPRKCLNTV